MCSTPKGSGLPTRVSRVEEEQRDARTYTDTLGRVSRRYEECQRQRQERKTDVDSRRHGYPGSIRPDALFTGTPCHSIS
jgi:hypothetical protein